jgi:regulator of protease activity HflC (stomatin/prohibitin superfamily)
MLKRLVLIAIVTILSTQVVGCAIVGSGEIGVKTTLGVAKSKPLQPGVHWATPVVDWVAKYDSKAQNVPEEFGSLTKDGQAVKVTGSLNYRINADHAPLIFSQVSSDVGGVKDKIVQPILLSVIKNVTSKYTMTELIANQGAFSDAVEKELSHRLASEKIGSIPKGDIAIVDSFNITGLVLDPQVQEAIERTAISKQMLQTAQNDVEVAKLQSQRNVELQKALTPEILMNEAIRKWDGSGIPPTVSGQQFLIQPQPKK